MSLLFRTFDVCLHWCSFLSCIDVMKLEYVCKDGAALCHGLRKRGYMHRRVDQWLETWVGKERWTRLKAFLSSRARETPMDISGSAILAALDGVRIYDIDEGVMGAWAPGDLDVVEISGRGGTNRFLPDEAPELFECQSMTDREIQEYKEMITSSKSWNNMVTYSLIGPGRPIKFQLVSRMQLTTQVETVETVETIETTGASDRWMELCDHAVQYDFRFTGNVWSLHRFTSLDKASLMLRTSDCHRVRALAERELLARSAYLQAAKRDRRGWSAWEPSGGHKYAANVCADRISKYSRRGFTIVSTTEWEMKSFPTRSKPSVDSFDS